MRRLPFEPSDSRTQTQPSWQSCGPEEYLKRNELPLTPESMKAYPKRRSELGAMNATRSQPSPSNANAPSKACTTLISAPHTSANPTQPQAQPQNLTMHPLRLQTLLAVLRKRDPRPQPLARPLLVMHADRARPRPEYLPPSSPFLPYALFDRLERLHAFGELRL